MSGFFALLWIVANAVTVVFIIKAIKEKEPVAKKKKRKIWLISLAVAVISLIVFAVTLGNTDSATTETEEVAESVEESVDDTDVAETEVEETEVEETEVADTETHLYDNAEVVDLKSGDGSKIIGTITIAKADSADCTDEALADWYFNYVLENSDSNYHVIVYNDIENKGVYANKGFIQKDIELIPETKDDTYYLGDDAGSTYYTVDETAKTISVHTVMADSSIIDDVVAKVDALISDEYKEGSIYAVDVAGEEGNLDCNLTLVGSSLADADYQALAVELAGQVKALNLGIGYFSIAFQSDDYTLNALSGIDNLSEQEPSEITTTTF